MTKEIFFLGGEEDMVIIKHFDNSVSLFTSDFFIEIVTSFAARIYGKRSHKAKRLLEAVLNELEGD